MTPEVRDTPLEVTLFGASKRHDKAMSYGNEIRALLDRVWPVLKARSIPNKGINWVVYDGDCGIFAGVEAEIDDAAALGLERNVVRLSRYVSRTHIGPYSTLGRTGDALNKAIEAMGLRPGWPMIEVYGHWTDDESKLETTIIRAVT
jgi:hypothetical protein